MAGESTPGSGQPDGGLSIVDGRGVATDEKSDTCRWGGLWFVLDVDGAL